MKKFILLALSLVMIICFASCSKSEEVEVIETTDDLVEVSEPFVTIYCLKDINGNVVKHILFNRQTNLTYVYDYQWVYDYGVFVCKNQWLTILDKDGKEVPDAPHIEGSSNNANSGDVYNNVYPEFQGSTVNFVPVKIFDTNGVFIYITDSNFNIAMNCWIYTVELINKNTYNCRVELTDGIIDGKKTQIYFGFNENMLAGSSETSQIQFVDECGYGIKSFNKWSAVINIYVENNTKIISETIHMGVAK